MCFDLLKEQVIQKLSLVFDPEIPVNIYDLGLIYKISFEKNNNLVTCYIELTLTSPSCPASDNILEQVYSYTKVIEEINDVNINLVFDPMWESSKISPLGREILESNGLIFP